MTCVLTLWKNEIVEANIYYKHNYPRMNINKITLYPTHLAGKIIISFFMKI